jgi:hypothetical protein
MSWQYTAYRSRSTIKVKSLCVINHHAMKTHGGVKIYIHAFLALKCELRPQGEPQIPSGQEGGWALEIVWTLRSRGMYIAPVAASVVQPAGLGHYTEWAIPAPQKVWCKEISILILTSVISSEFPELQQSILWDQSIFHNVLAHSLDKTHTFVSVLTGGIYL